MTKKIRLTTFFLLSIVLLFAACGKKDDPTLSEQINEYSLSRATNYGNDWIYFSFSKGSEVSGVTEENRAERLDWDIAFNKANMRTNSGLSGKGKGGALKLSQSKLMDVKEAPASGYIEDNIIKITKDLSSMPPPMIETPGNSELAKAITFSGPPPLYTIHDNVFIVKTAAGKYVKVKFISFYNKEGKSGYLTFQYKILE